MTPLMQKAIAVLDDGWLDNPGYNNEDTGCPVDLDTIITGIDQETLITEFQTVPKQGILSGG